MHLLEDRVDYLETHEDRIGNFECTWGIETILHVIAFIFIAMTVPLGVGFLGFIGKGPGALFGPGISGFNCGVSYGLGLLLLSVAGWWLDDPFSKWKSSFNALAAIGMAVLVLATIAPIDEALGLLAGICGFGGIIYYVMRRLQFLSPHAVHLPPWTLP